MIFMIHLHGHTSWCRDVVFDAIFKNISVVEWHSVLLMDETRVPRENH